MFETQPQIIATLKAKRNDIEASIKLYEGKLKHPCRDVAHVNATLAIFASTDPMDIRTYTDTSRLFRQYFEKTVAENGLGLTPGESRIAALVGCGHSPRDAAVKLGIAEETARTVLKRVYEKLQIRRQGELATFVSQIALISDRRSES